MRFISLQTIVLAVIMGVLPAAGAQLMSCKSYRWIATVACICVWFALTWLRLGSIPFFLNVTLAYACLALVAPAANRKRRAFEMGEVFLATTWACCVVAEIAHLAAAIGPRIRYSLLVYEEIPVMLGTLAAIVAVRFRRLTVNAFVAVLIIGGGAFYLAAHPYRPNDIDFYMLKNYVAPMLAKAGTAFCFTVPVLLIMQGCLRRLAHDSPPVEIERTDESLDAPQMPMLGVVLVGLSWGSACAALTPLF